MLTSCAIVKEILLNKIAKTVAEYSVWFIKYIEIVVNDSIFKNCCTKLCFIACALNLISSLFRHYRPSISFNTFYRWIARNVIALLAKPLDVKFENLRYVNACKNTDSEDMERIFRQ